MVRRILYLSSVTCMGKIEGCREAVEDVARDMAKIEVRHPCVGSPRRHKGAALTAQQGDARALTAC